LIGEFISKYIPNWLITLLHVLFVVLVNPFVIAINFVLVWMNLAQETSTNISKLPAWSIPIWILAGMAIAAALIAIQFTFIRVIAKISYTKYRWLDSIAHLPYLPFLIASDTFMFGELEGNIIGFIVFPAYLITTLITLPISFFLSVILIIWARKTSYEESD